MSKRDQRILCILWGNSLKLGQLLYMIKLVMVVQVIIVLSLFALMVWTFISEKEWGATLKAVFVFLIYGLVVALCWLVGGHAILVFGFLFNLSLLLVLFPFSVSSVKTDAEPLKQFDERDTMFSRNELRPGTPRFSEYYQRRPGMKALDEKFRKEPGLLDDNALYYHKQAFEATRKKFCEIKELHPKIAGDIKEQPKQSDTALTIKEIMGRLKEMGAVHLGCTKLKPYHFYSVKGRGKRYGDPIALKHKYAIAFTVEMRHEMVKPAPQASIVLESAEQYLRSAKMAIELAEFIRASGYDALAHIDGNYELICPLVARDAGLGEIGRMGLLMTKNFGPRVRIAIVSTNLELPVHTYKQDGSVIDFCSKCKKCAACCPSKSIAFDNPRIIEGVKRWQINSESCFTYWCRVGTDCGRCMAVCPYSHPNSAMHKWVRMAIRFFPNFRYPAIWLDNFFYGRKPRPGKLPNKFLTES